MMQKRMIHSLSISLAIHVALLIAILLSIMLKPEQKEVDRIEISFIPLQTSPLPGTSGSQSNAENVAQSEPAATQQATQSPPAQQAVQNTQSNPVQNSSTSTSSSVSTPDFSDSPLDFNQTQANTTTNRQSRNLSNSLNTQNSTDTEAPEGFDPQASTSNASNTSANSTSQQSTNQTADSVDGEVDVALNSINTSSTSTPGSESSSTATTPGSIDSRLSGDIAASGRTLISANRLGLSGYLSEVRTNWPDSITVEFLVHPDGFVTILNELQLNSYTILYAAITRVFSGQVFTAATGAADVSGEIRYVLR